MGQEPDRQPDARARTAPYHRRRMARPVRRHPAGSETAADGARVQSESRRQMAADRPLHAARIPRMPLALLHGHHADGEDNPCGNREAHVPQPAHRAGTAARNEGPRARHVPSHPAGRLQCHGPTGAHDVVAELFHRQRHES